MIKDCCYICQSFRGRRGYSLGTCKIITEKYQYKMTKGDLFNTFPIIHADGICNRFKQQEIE